MASTPAKKHTHTEKTRGEKAARQKVGQTNINKTADEKVPYLLDWIYSGGMFRKMRTLFKCVRRFCLLTVSIQCMGARIESN